MISTSRKLQKIGAAFWVSLPADWCKKNFEQGKRNKMVEIEIKDDCLIIRTKGE